MVVVNRSGNNFWLMNVWLASLHVCQHTPEFLAKFSLSSVMGLGQAISSSFSVPSFARHFQVTQSFGREPVGFPKILIIIVQHTNVNETLVNSRYIHASYGQDSTKYVSLENEVLLFS